MLIGVEFHHRSCILTDVSARRWVIVGRSAATALSDPDARLVLAAGDVLAAYVRLELLPLENAVAPLTRKIADPSCRRA